MADMGSLELRIAELETRVRQLSGGSAVAAALRAFSSGSCTNNCTAACTIGCTKGCTGPCGEAASREITQPAPVQTATLAERDALASYDKLAGGRG
jgi:hypothetical protein